MLDESRSPYSRFQVLSPGQGWLHLPDCDCSLCATGSRANSRAV